MKKKLISLFSLVMTAVLLNIIPVTAEEKAVTNPNAPAEEFLYCDLDNDGEDETLRYVSIPFEEDNTVFLEIYAGEELLYDDIAKDAYVWYVYPLQDESEKTYLCAKSVGDNDFCSNIKLLELTPDGSLLELGDAMTLDTPDLSSNNRTYLSAWINFRSLSPLKEDEFLASGLIMSDHAGVLEANVNCTLYNHMLHASEGPYPLTSDYTLYGVRTDGWRTVSIDFTLYTEPASEEEAFQAKTGDKLTLSSAAWKDNILYIECENQNCEKGWFPDRNLNEPVQGTTDVYFEDVFCF